MNKEELLPCPFCGKQPSYAWRGSESVECKTPACAIAGVVMSKEEWQFRYAYTKVGSGWLKFIPAHKLEGMYKDMWQNIKKSETKNNV